MTKKEMAAKLAKKTGLSVAKATEVINEIFDANPGKGIIATSLDAGGKVTIPGFGTFGTRQRGAREAINPSTRKKTQVPKRQYVYFKVGKTLKERVQV
jgi:nucleoid DNA-binding protein